MEEIKFKPLFDRILVKAKPAEEKTKSGIILAESAKERPLEGIVMAIGNGTSDEVMVVQVGDIVLYGAYSGTTVKIEEVEYLIMRQSDVFGIL